MVGFGRKFDAVLLYRGNANAPLHMHRLTYLALPLLLLVASCSSQPPVQPTPTLPIPTATPSYPASVTRFQVQNPDSKVMYRISETFLENVSAIINFDPQPGVAETVGTTRAVNGHLAVNLTQSIPEVVGGQFSVDLLTLRTNKERRDENIRVEWLESYRYPTATFEIVEAQQLDQPLVEGQVQSFDLRGELTVRDVTVPIELAVTAQLDGDRLAATGSVPLRLSQFGIEPPTMANIVEVEDAFVLEVVLVAVAR